MSLVAVVLAAGEGRRLRPLTALRPKALCPVNDVPLLDRALAAVTPHVEDVAVNAHHLAEQVLACLRGRVHVSVEQPVALGTAGALAALREWVDGRDVLVHNADAYLPAGVADLVTGWDGTRATLLARHAPGRGDFGDLRYVGACVLPWRDVARLEPVPSGLYEVQWRHETPRLLETTAVAIDCGTPADYLRANLHASGGRSVVGAGAVVAGELVRSVVWPDGVVRRGERLVEAIRAGADLTVPAPLCGEDCSGGR